MSGPHESEWRSGTSAPKRPFTWTGTPGCTYCSREVSLRSSALLSFSVKFAILGSRISLPLWKTWPTGSNPRHACVDALFQNITPIGIPLEVNVSFAAFGSGASSALSRRACVSCCRTATWSAGGRRWAQPLNASIAARVVAMVSVLFDIWSTYFSLVAVPDHHQGGKNREPLGGGRWMGGAYFYFSAAARPVVSPL